MTTTSGSQVAGSSRSSFSQTCNLLSLYLKEKRSFADFNLGIPAAATNVHQTTMNLFPQEAGLQGYIEPPVAKAAKHPQMTIFYGGQVFVLNDLPANKAREIMDIAARGSTTGSLPNGDSSKATVRLRSADMMMPLARKASLHRFFEKRKDRISAKAPYSIPKSSTVVDEPNKANINALGETLLSSSSWLGLAARPAF